MEEILMNDFDVIIVGAGNAAFCAALSAKETGASVLVLERSPEELNGGNSRFTAGAMRFAYDKVNDIRALCPDLSEEQIDITDFGTYTTDQFFDDMFRITRYRTDPELCDRLVTDSRDTMMWMLNQGIRFMPIYGRQAFKVDGRFKFWGGLTLETWGGGPGLVDRHTELAIKAGINIRYGARARELLFDGHKVTGVRVSKNGEMFDVTGNAVILAAGGFQSNTEMRTRYLGPSWEMAKVRGTAFNTGDGIRMALDIGASSIGNWSGCHAVGWDYNAPEYGDLAVGDGFQKHSYPFGIMVNANGRRFVDEGADFRNYTYAKYGRIVLEQPDQFSWQVFDQKVTHLLRDEYRIKQVSKVSAPTLEQLVDKMEGVDKVGFLSEIKNYNEAVNTSVAFDPNIKDGRSTKGLSVPKSNWANTISDGPFEAYHITCGITFTFGGLRIGPYNSQVISDDRAPIPGLYAAGELVGGLFYFNYPGGAGLMSGSVFGRQAGRNAAQGDKT